MANFMKVNSKNKFPQLLFIFLVLVAVFVPYFVPAFLVVLLISVYMYVVLCVSWSAFCVPANYISLGTAAFFGAGIYTSAVLQGISFPVVIIVSGLVSFVVGLLVGLTTLRLRGMYFCVLTFGLSELLRHSMVWYEVNITGTVGRWLTLLNHVTVYYYMLAIVCLTVITIYFSSRSKWGLALRCIGESEEAAAHIGINVNIVKIVIFGITCFFMGATGAVMATRWSYIDPDLAFAPTVTFFTIMMVLVGGWGSGIYGPVLGAAILTILSDMVLAQFPSQMMLLFGFLLLVVIVFFPKGLMGLIRQKT